VSSGNEAVVDFADVLAFMAADPRIRVVAGYLEGVRDGRKLRDAAAVARAHGKPVVLLKVGRVAESAAAAASHTGALTGAYSVYRAALSQWGILEVDSIGELFDLIETFALGTPPAPGACIGIVTNSGGIGVFCADKVREHGLGMAALSAQTTAAIAARLPEFGSADNPVDFTLQAFTDPASVGSHIRQVMSDEGVDLGLAFFGVQMLNVEALVDEIAAANALNRKPLLVGWLLGDPVGPRRLRAAGVPCFDDPLAAIKAARGLVTQGRITAEVRQERDPRPLAAAKALVEDLGEGAVSEWQARALIEAAGIPVARGVLAADAEAAVAAAREIAGAVAVKVVSADIAHKTEAGAVALDVVGDQAVRAAFARVTEGARAHAPGAAIAGVGVTEMVTGAVELIAGFSRDPAFGPVVLVGLGGMFAEVLEDTALGVAPLAHADAEAMVRSLQGYPILEGARGRARCDTGAVVDVLLALSDLALACPEIAELDINPLMALPEGQGVKAADALATLRRERA
jgi:acetyltransferase